MGTIIGIVLLIASLAFLVIGAWRNYKQAMWTPTAQQAYNEGDADALPAYQRRDYSALHEAIAQFLREQREVK